MQLRFVKSVQPRAQEHGSLSKITALTWSPSSQKIAVVSTQPITQSQSRGAAGSAGDGGAAFTPPIVQLYDEQGVRQDRFSTKPGGEGSGSYRVSALAFSPCSTRLAVAQSDAIVFVYKLGEEWRAKKSICNKFPQTSSVTALCWPSKQPQQLVFSLSEGKVKVGQLKANKAALLFQSENNSPVTTLTNGPDGNSFLSGHADGTVFRFLFETEAAGPVAQRFAKLPSPIACLSWGAAGVCAGGADRILRFYGSTGGSSSGGPGDLGREIRAFDLSAPINTGNQQQGGSTSSSTALVGDLTVAAFNPSGESVVVGTSNSRLLVFHHNSRTKDWIMAGGGGKEIPNLYALTALCWRGDGSRLLAGSLCGTVELFDACIRKVFHRNSFEFTYISLSQVIVRSLASGARIVLKSNVGLEIQKINVYRDRFLVAHTPESLLLGDLESCRLSEIPWAQNTNQEKPRFMFDHPPVCLIFRAGELTVLAYGSNEVLGWARTEYMSPHLISVQMPDNANFASNPAADSANSCQRLLAYLLDAQTIRVMNLASNAVLASLSHDCSIDWLELNPAATTVLQSQPSSNARLLFRDTKRQLHLLNIATGQRTTLLESAGFVSWVPKSQVVVAQSRTQLCVWYSIHNAPDKVTMHEIKGSIDQVVRENGRTLVQVDEIGGSTGSIIEYELDEPLINFGACLERRAYSEAIDILEELPLTQETSAMWLSLAKAAETDLTALPVVEVCYAVLGDVSKAKYIGSVNELIAEQPQEGVDHYSVVAKMAILNKQFGRAEAILLENNRLEQAMALYQELHR